MIHLLQAAVQNRVWVLFTMLVISVFGSYMVTRLPVDAVPDITNVQVVVNSLTGALDPEQIEKSVTYPIESEMAVLPQVEEIRSISKYGLSQVVVVFEDGVDIYRARSMVAEKLASVRDKLPAGVSSELGPVSTGLGEVLMYAVKARDGSRLAAQNEQERLLYLRWIQDYYIRPALKKIRGVAEIDSNGGYRKEVHVNIMPAKLEREGVTIEELLRALENVGENAGGGYIEHRGQQVIVRTAGSVETLAEIANLPVKMRFNGSVVRVGDIASVRFDAALRVGAATQNGQEIVLGTVLMRLGANSRQVAHESEQVLHALVLPEDVTVEILYSRSFLVDATIKTVMKNLAEGAGLVIVILLLILGNFRAALIVSLAIPLSMLAAVLGMQFSGVSANLMSLGAIDFGLLVDASVVLVENTLKKFEMNPELAIHTKKRLALLMEAAREIMKPVTTGLFIIMLVYVPILALEGIEGKMFRPMAVTVLMALGASLLVAVTVMPVLLLMVLRKPEIKTGAHEAGAFRYIRKLYEPSLHFFLRYPAVAYAIAGIILLLSPFLFLRLGSDFVPVLDEGDGVIMLARSPATSLSASIAMQKKSEHIAALFPEVEKVFSRIGTPESATDPMGPNLADTFLILKKDRSQWRKNNGRTITKEELLQEIASEIERQLPDQEIAITQPIAMRFNEILEGSRADVNLRIFGNDLHKLMEYAEKAEAILKPIPGTAAVEMDALTALKKSPVLDIKPDKQKLAAYGVPLSAINLALGTAMSGYQSGYFTAEGIRIPVKIHMDENLRNDPAAIAAIPVMLPDGGSIRLGTVTKQEWREQVTTVARNYGRRYAALAIYIRDRDIGSFVAEAKEKIAREMPLPAGYSTEWGGQFKNLEKARARLLLLVPMTLLFIFLLLARSFNSWREATLVFLSIPFATTGGIYLLYLRGIPFSVSAAVGFIALSGIAILNGMVLVSFFRQLRHQGHPLHEVVVQGALARLRPVTMTALVAALGFLPMAFNTGLGAEVQRPLATVVIGGLVTSTLLTLVLLPLLYRRFAAKV